jgi:hypothetical protein
VLEGDSQHKCARAHAAAKLLERQNGASALSDPLVCNEILRRVLVQVVKDIREYQLRQSPVLAQGPRTLGAEAPRIKVETGEIPGHKFKTCAPAVLSYSHAALPPTRRAARRMEASWSNKVAENQQKS